LIPESRILGLILSPIAQAMTILILTSLLSIGLILILIEVFLIPGTTIVGICGFLASLLGVYYAFLVFDSGTALWVAGIAAIANLAAIWYGFTSGVWKHFSLKGTMKGGAFDGRTLGLAAGMVGKAISDIKPFGKVLFGDQVYEVKSEEGFIEVGKTVNIIKIENNKILVK
jgi:membrane-bound ClpP family serine protease